MIEQLCTKKEEIPRSKMASNGDVYDDLRIGPCFREISDSSGDQENIRTHVAPRRLGRERRTGRAAWVGSDKVGGQLCHLVLGLGLFPSPATPPSPSSPHSAVVVLGPQGLMEFYQAGQRHVAEDAPGSFRLGSR